MRETGIFSISDGVCIGPGSTLRWSMADNHDNVECPCSGAATGTMGRSVVSRQNLSLPAIALRVCFAHEFKGMFERLGPIAINRTLTLATMG